MKRSQPITIWSVLALSSLIVLGGTTVLLTRMTLAWWVRGGDRFAMDATGRMTDEIRLTAGEHIVYYESPVGLPDEYMMYINPSDDPSQRIERRMIVNNDPFSQDNRFEYGGIHGKPICRMMIPADGVYSFTFINSNEEIPEGDHIVFNKQPRSLDEVMQRRTTMQFAGLSVTGVLFVTCYLLHAVTLSRRARAAQKTVASLNN